MSFDLDHPGHEPRLQKNDLQILDRDTARSEPTDPLQPEHGYRLPSSMSADPHVTCAETQHAKVPVTTCVSVVDVR